VVRRADDFWSRRSGRAPLPGGMVHERLNTLCFLSGVYEVLVTVYPAESNESLNLWGCPIPHLRTGANA
jgi:hypothetical protein